MHLTGMDIRDTPPFTKLVELDFDARVNVFIGPNASGKSTILKEMDAAFNGSKRPEPSFRIYHPEPSYQYQDPSVIYASRKQYIGWDWKSDRDRTLLFAQKDGDEIEAYTSPNPPVVYIGPVRSELPELYDFEAAGKEEIDEDIDVDGEVRAALGEPFSGANFKIATEKVYQKANAMFAQEKNDDIPTDQRRAYRVFQLNRVVHPCVQTICAEILTDDELRNYVTGLFMEDIDFQPMYDRDTFKIHPSLGITTVDEPNFTAIRPEDRPSYSDLSDKAPLYVGFLSSGTQATFLWIYWLALKMLLHYDFADGWQNKPAILLIDEIENHLHPTWQRRVIPALLEHFPGLQILATTHSPFVVAGLRAGQVHLLDRNSEGMVTATTTEQDIIGWTTDEILRSFMGVAEPTDELTIRRTKRLRELRRKESLSDEEGEELETLRQQVNADFLSSRSPLALQRERYGEMMQRFIESRQGDLSQDG